MSAEENASFHVVSWNETPLQEISVDTKIVSARVVQSYKGELEGEGKVEYLMYYDDAKTASFTGYETFIGEYKGRAGRFVMMHSGRYEDGVASSRWGVVAGSGSDNLSGLTGHGTFKAGAGGKASVQLMLKIT